MLFSSDSRSGSGTPPRAGRIPTGRRPVGLLLVLVLSSFTLLPPREPARGAPASPGERLEHSLLGQPACHDCEGAENDDQDCCPGGCTECWASCCLGLVADLAPALDLSPLGATPLPPTDSPAELASADLVHPDPPPRA